MAVDIGRFVKAPEFEITIVTCRDVFQAAACEEDRFAKECVELSALIILDRAQLKRMGLKDGNNVRLTSRWGSVVVKAKASAREEQKGVGFMVNSPWSNALVSDGTGDGIPDYKNIKTKIASSKEAITSIQELFE